MTDLHVFWDDSFTAHTPPAGEFETKWSGRLAAKEPHPDREERVRNIRSIIEHVLDDRANWQSVAPATKAQLNRVHSSEYITEFERFCEAGGGRLTAETGANEASYSAARHAAGAAIQAAETAIDCDDSVPYALVRPSGHHAQPTQADGFCFFNNIAVAAEHLLQTEDIERVGILDWDVHHGNGTQECFYDRDDVLFVSLHNDHWSWDPNAHPQTGDVDEYGVGTGQGYNLNIPLPPGTGNSGYEAAFDRIVEPVFEAYDPDVLLISAGQDPGVVDPLGRNVVTKRGFESFGRRARRMAEKYSDGRFAIVQEGGYQVSHLAYATLGVLEGSLGVETGIEDPFAWLDEDLQSARAAVTRIADRFTNDWPVVA
ncbi:class II histone deacetylase [Haladaptatus caseinilyticus]|uniref:class II histone deacetylase n=1 Tax=Haladaptatus caseinilyticus TaxID=2993314 RepID=UPI00224B6DDF|nr:class II histone deacetylase [Haladaptatus caseinilyticus]